MKLLRFLFIIAAVLGLSTAAFGGWVQMDKEGNTTMISEGMIKQMPRSEQEQYSILDVKKGFITSIDPKRRVYMTESVEDFCRDISLMADKAMKGAGEMMKSMSPEERAMMEQMMPGMFKEKGKSKRTVKVSVASEGDGGMVAGYKTEKYRITADGKLYEEVWLTSDVLIMKELEAFYKTFSKKFEKCMSSMMQGAQMFDVEESQEYQKLMQAGWELKSTRYFMGGQPYTHEVVKMEKKNIPASEFMPPPGFKKVPFSEFWVMKRE